MELKDKSLSKEGDKVLNHYKLHYINLPFHFLDRNLESIGLIDVYLDLSTDFNLEHLPSPYWKRIKSYIVNIAYKTKDKKV
jgi:hypothetical protein